VLRRIFGLKRDEVPGVWRKLHNVFWIGLARGRIALVALANEVMELKVP
jgi:hypothetical protein